LSIREYPIIMGDSPAAARGVPISIGWEFEDANVDIYIDEYESLRPPRRLKDQLRMESLDRVRLLKSELIGYSRSEICQGIRQVDKDRKQREITRNWMRFSRLEEAVEAIARFIMLSTIRRSQRNQMKQYLAPYKSAQHHGSNRKKSEIQRRTKRNTWKNSTAQEMPIKDYVSHVIKRISSLQVDTSTICTEDDSYHDDSKGSIRSKRNREVSSTVDVAGQVRVIATTTKKKNIPPSYGQILFANVRNKKEDEGSDDSSRTDVTSRVLSSLSVSASDLSLNQQACVAETEAR
jgi:hypothetical protein